MSNKPEKDNCNKQLKFHSLLSYYENLLRKVLVFPCSKIPIPIVFVPTDFRSNNSHQDVIGVSYLMTAVRKNQTDLSGFSPGLGN